MESGKLVECMELLSQASWSSFIAEKQHCSAACLRKYHPDLGVESLGIRSHLHCFKQLLGTESGKLKRIEALQRSLQK
eukprot:1635003-Amphidinium_carterae.1